MMKNKHKTIAKIIIVTALIQGAIIAFGLYAFRTDDPASVEESAQLLEEDSTASESSPEVQGLAEEAQEQIEDDEMSHKNDDAQENAAEQQEVASEPTRTFNTLSCDSDCTLAPVDKDNALPSTYNPGGLTSNTQSAFSELKSAAKSEDVSIATISQFRSYATQASTFESWVQVEMSKGNSRTKAEQIANTYSARPGHSEHQLGTTIDVKCSGCSDWGNDNDELYDWIEDKAHLYGFVVSYPKNSESLTGYTYEPWHIRWIGVDLATELYDTGYVNGNGNYVAKFLRDKGY